LVVPDRRLARADEVDRMKRREFMALLSGAAVAPSTASRSSPQGWLAREFYSSLEQLS
jgi:hypothetical protein